MTKQYVEAVGRLVSEVRRGRLADAALPARFTGEGQRIELGAGSDRGVLGLHPVLLAKGRDPGGTVVPPNVIKVG
jgi:hypothetical protein